MVELGSNIRIIFLYKKLLQNIDNDMFIKILYADNENKILSLRANVYKLYITCTKLCALGDESKILPQKASEWLV